jgi:hypothetical protein
MALYSSYTILHCESSLVKSCLVDAPNVAEMQMHIDELLTTRVPRIFYLHPYGISVAAIVDHCDNPVPISSLRLDSSQVRR